MKILNIYDSYNMNSEYIFSMSLPRKDVASKLEETTRPLCKHIVKLCMYSDKPEYVNHWKQEVYDILHNVSRIKGRNKFPSSKFILYNTINVNIYLLDSWIKIIKDDYSKQLGLPINEDEIKIRKCLLDYYEWIANMLSTQGEVSRLSVYTELDRLIN